MMMTLELQEATRMKEIQREIGLADAMDRIGRDDSSDDEKTAAVEKKTEVE